MQGITTARPEIEAVIFDYGAVLCFPPTEAEFEEFAALAGMPAGRFREAYPKSRARYDRGDVSTSEHWQEFGRAAGIAYSDAQIQALHAVDLRVWRRVDPRMIDLAGRLRTAGVRTAVLSNMEHGLREILRSEADWLRHFDVQVFSCDVRHVKPEPEIYCHALAALDVRPEAAFFVDDVAANVEGARRVGVEGVVYRSFEELTAILEPLFARRNGGASKAEPE